MVLLVSQNNLIYLVRTEYLLAACIVCPCLSAVNGKMK